MVAVTRSTFTPSTRAAVGFSAIARIPRPSRVRATSSPSATTRTTEITRIATWTTETWAPSTANVASGIASAGNRFVSGPHRPCSSAMNTPASAIEEISPAKCASGRSFNGRKATRSITRPSRAPTTNTTGSINQTEMPRLVTSSMPT